MNRQLILYLFQSIIMNSKSEAHEQNRVKVCGVCFRKPKSKMFQKISPFILNLIWKHSFNDYSLEDTSLQVIICLSCTQTIKVIDSGKVDRKLPAVDYNELVKPQTVSTTSTVS